MHITNCNLPQMFHPGVMIVSLISSLSKKYRDTTQSNKSNNQSQNPKNKTITWNKETQMTTQHEALW